MSNMVGWVIHSYDNPVPEIIHSVAVIFTASAIPNAVSVRVPVEPPGESRSVSVLIAIDTAFVVSRLMNPIRVPISNGTELLAGMVSKSPAQRPPDGECRNPHPTARLCNCLSVSFVVG